MPTNLTQIRVHSNQTNQQSKKRARARDTLQRTLGEHIISKKSTTAHKLHQISRPAAACRVYNPNNTYYYIAHYLLYVCVCVLYGVKKVRACNQIPTTYMPRCAIIICVASNTTFTTILAAHKIYRSRNLHAAAIHFLLV